MGELQLTALTEVIGPPTVHITGREQRAGVLVAGGDLQNGNTRRETLDLVDDGPRDYARYGFRVPAVVVSPYARPDYVCGKTLDHTSVLKLIEEKWNLPPLTRRDAAAS